MALPNEPITRREMYLSNIAGQNTALPDAPITREEMYLDYIAKTGGTGEGDMKKSVYDSDNSVASAGGIKMFVNQKIGTLPQRVGSLETTAGVLEGEVASIEDTLDNLGTASTKNSTSVVTESSDLVESGAVKEYVDGKLGTIYSFHVSGSESNPANRITYIGDTEGMTPVHMDYANDVFDWGSWRDAFFLPRPCMVRSDGTVDYYLDPNDYTKRMDGTASDVGNINYDGNAMMEWGRNGHKIWTKIVPDNDHFCQHTDIMLATPGYEAIIATQMAQLEAVRQANEAAAAAAAAAAVASQDG